MTKRYDLTGKRVWVAGHRGMVGSAIKRHLEARGDCELVLADRKQVDLTDQGQTADFIGSQRPQAVFLAAAKVGGIHANDTNPAAFLYENLMIASNVIHACHGAGTEKLLFLGSSCIYPRMAEQPMKEDQLLTGPLEPTNEWYAVAKIAGIKLCQAYRRQYGNDFIAAMPTNLYGPGDNFDLQTSHVLPALIRKAVEAKARGEAGLTIWGSGEPRREFMYVEDTAAALVHLMEHYSGEDFVNVGTGHDVSIAEAARMIMEIVGLEGELRTDRTKPDGTPRKLMDVSKLSALGFTAETPLYDGLLRTVAWYLEHKQAV
ncbi:GDP-L-fucose synthase family protein [Parvularcula maris]|uniref:GDP-L-fucose synthase n=1 Tax=Parvularcula maris TaxID=2965077 RepID=A0A9X2L8U0_9PROT|nr:GDP-L-fucose synthase [Parvularcula maris]MCQ8185142.1 GDP-L-fucose synthase [Parvularcula maris]